MMFRTLIALLVPLGSAQEPAVAPRPPANPAFASIEDVPGLPRVLLLGDSISIGYTPDVRERLESVANVHRPAENCGPTTRGLERLDAWLGDGDWDVIHLNFGLHDLKFVDDQGDNTAPDSGHHQVSPEDYRENLDAILERLEATDATLIFATTTPVPPGEPQRLAGDELQYNAIAQRVMEQHGVTINDLHTFIIPRFDEVSTAPNNVHFTPEGSALLADEVADAITVALERRE